MKGQYFQTVAYFEQQYIDSISRWSVFDAIRCIHKCHISNIQIDGEVKFLLVNCKFPMTSKLHMLHGVDNPYMVICNQSAKFHDCTLSRLLEPVYIEHIQQHPYTEIVILDTTKMTVFKGSEACFYT